MSVLRIIVAAFVALATLPAAAQETGTLVERRAAQIDGNSVEDARRAMSQFGACLVSRSRGRIMRMIDVAVDSAQYRTLYNNLFDDQDACLSDGTLRTSELMLRGSIFEALYIRDFGKAEGAAFSPELDTGYRMLYGAPLSERARMYLSLETFGECVSRADPKGVQSLLLSLIGSSTENEMITRLMPRFSKCIVKENTIRFSKTNLRGFLAEGLYRLSRAAAVAGAKS